METLPQPAILPATVPAARLSPPASATVLLIATAIWGTTFVAARLLLAGNRPAMGPGALVFFRFAIAAAVFTPALVRNPASRPLWRCGLELGFWLWCGFATQAIGLVYTSVSRSAFVTSLNVIFVPVLTVVAGRRVGWLVWAAAIGALIGAGLLSSDGSYPNRGDVWTLACAIFWGVYIFRLEGIAQRFTATSLTAVQLWVVAGLAALWAGGERAVMGGAVQWSPQVVASLLYLGLAATAATTWLQAIGQRGLPAPLASLLYTTEPLFATAIAMIWFDEQLGVQGWIGGGLILAAAIAGQLAPMLLGKSRLPADQLPTSEQSLNRM